MVTHMKIRIPVSGLCRACVLSGRFVCTIFILMIFCLNFCGCSKEAKLPMEKVRIAIAKEMLSSLAIIADSEGLFAQNGLEAEIRYYPSGKLALGAMLSGQADFATTAETPLVFGSFERQDFSVIASIGSSYNEAVIIARRDKGIETAKDLTGKRIATVQGTSLHYFLSVFMMKYGLSKEDIELSFMEPDQMPKALESGRIDASPMREPYISQAKALIKDNAVIISEPGIYHKIYAIVGINEIIRGKPMVAVKLLKALAMAEKLCRKNKGRAIGIVSAKFGIRNEETASVWPELFLGLSLGQQLLMALEQEARWAVMTGLTDSKKIPDYQKFINTEVLTDLKPEAISIIK